MRWKVWWSPDSLGFIVWEPSIHPIVYLLKYFTWKVKTLTCWWCSWKSLLTNFNSTWQRNNKRIMASLQSNLFSINIDLNFLLFSLLIDHFSWVRPLAFYWPCSTSLSLLKLTVSRTSSWGLSLSSIGKNHKCNWQESIMMNHLHGHSLYMKTNIHFCSSCVICCQQSRPLSP